MRFVLLGLPPTTNNLYTIVAGRQVKSAVGRDYAEAVSEVARRAWSDEALRGPFAVLVTYHLGAYNRDVDGSHKAIVDGCSGIIWHDDKQVVLFAARKRRAPAGVLPYVSVVVRQLAAMPAWQEPTAPPAAAELRLSPLPPTTNNSYAIFRGIRRKTAAARAASAVLEEAMCDAAPVIPWSGPLRLRLRYAMAVDRRDVDGSHKLLLDAARSRWWRDDLQLTSFSAAKSRISGAEGLHLAAWPLSDEAIALATDVAEAA